MSPSGIPQVNVLFPMAAHSAHLGYKYKPFMSLGDETVIEAAVRPFRKWAQHIGRLCFVCLQQQEAEFSVARRLTELFPDLPHEVILLEQPTGGPAETVSQGACQAKLAGPTIICDADHSLDVDPLFAKVRRENQPDCAFPVWEIRGESLSHWSVASCRSEDRVSGIAERRLPDASGDFRGVIGCYYFRDIRALAEQIRAHQWKYISQAIASLIAAGKAVEYVTIERAEFYGDTKQVRQVRAKREHFIGSIFCDLDGTVIEHEDIPSYDNQLKLLPGSAEKLRQWVDEGYMIVLMTARHSQDQALLEAALAIAEIPYHHLIMGLASGPRYAINDRKPSAILTPQVASFEVSRNEGIAHITIPAVGRTILKRFHGASLADTLLVEDDEKLFVRKRVLKRQQLALGYMKLRSQYRLLERFAQLGEIVPAPYGDQDNSLEYYYDMEFLSQHQPLSRLPLEQQVSAFEAILGVFQERVYSIKTETPDSGVDWLLAHFGKKIFAKLDGMQSNPALARLVNAEEVCIDGERFPGLSSLLAQATSPAVARRFGPRWLSTVHGDLTFENILYAEGDARVIDMDAGDVLDAPELDLGKLFQSLVGRYEDWAHVDGPLYETFDEGEIRFKTPLQQPSARLIQLFQDRWSNILACSPEQAYWKGIFYMSLHLIRMIPFRLRVSEEQACFALARAIQWMGRALADE
jgi:hypothetical protein